MMPNALLGAAVLIIACLLSNRVFGRLGMPTLLAFLGLGMLCGSDGLLKIAFDDFALSEQVSSVALIFIIFYGGFWTNWRLARPVVGKAVLLSSAGVVLTAVLVGAFCHWALGMPPAESLLVGALISSTDAASVFSILRAKRLNLRYGTASMLEMESGSNDCFSYMLTVVILAFMGGSAQSPGAVAWMLGLQIVAGALCGVGIALAGFVQLMIWGIMLAAILAVAGVITGASVGLADVAGAQGLPAGAVADQETADALTAVYNLPWVEMGVMFVLYFVGAYLLYSSFFAAVGASINEQDDSSQFMMPVIVLLVFGLYAAIYGIENPDGPLCFWTSIFPLTSPVVMMARIPFGVPLWQELLSLVLLYLTVALMIWAAGKIYRVGILMYGKKPSFKDMLRWIRFQ